MLLFSVIIPVYNTERYLVECVQSILKQDFKSWEIILVDDSSTDKSGEICDSFGEQNESIKVIHHERNCGVSVSRNSGINAARGKYIIFLDSDDYLFDGCLNDIAKLIEEKPQTDVFIGKHNRSADGCISDSAVINTSDSDDVIGHINNLSYFIGFCWRFVIDRNFIIENNLYFINVKTHEDEEYVARLLCLSRKFAFYNGCFYQHRVIAGSLSCSIDYDSSAACLDIANEMCKFIKNNNLSDFKKEYMHSRIKFIFKYFYPRLFMRNREEIYALSKIIEKNIDNFKILENTSSDIDMYFFIKTYGAYCGLLLYKAFITEETISLIKNTKYKELYIFCVGLFGEATARILQNEGYYVKGFLDNNKALEGSLVLGLKVSNPAIFSYKSRDELSDVFVIVCSQRTSHFEEISSQLEEIGLKKEQIARKIFDDDRLIKLRELRASGDGRIKNAKIRGCSDAHAWE